MSEKVALAVLIGCAAIVVAILNVVKVDDDTPYDKYNASRLCTGKYRRLAKYFIGCREDLKEVDVQQLTDRVELRHPHDIDLLKQFIAEHASYFAPIAIASCGEGSVGTTSLGASDITDAATSLCVGPFRRLHGYFDGLSLMDLREIDVDMMCDSVEARDPRDAILLRRLVRHHAKHFTPTMAICCAEVTVEGCGICLAAEGDGLRLDVSGKKLFTQETTADLLLDSVRRITDCAWSRIIYLDVRGCQIDGTRLHLVESLMTHMPLCSFVDLRDNPICDTGGYERAFEAITHRYYSSTNVWLT
jgi:hypothetical protein